MPAHPDLRERMDRPERKPHNIDWNNIEPTPKAKIDEFLRVNRIQTRIRERNHERNTYNYDTPRHLINKSDGTRFELSIIHRDKNKIIGANFTKFSDRFGHPSHGYAYWGRPVKSYDVAYRKGYRDGFAAGLHYGSHWNRHHHKPVFLFFYTNFYYDDPFFTGFWYPGYYPNVYYYYGWLPRWCAPPSVYIFAGDPYPVQYWSSGPRYYYINNSSTVRIDEKGMERAIKDIRTAWLEGDIDRLAYHIRPDKKISVYFDNDYSYSLSDEDYYSMTLDAMSTIKTVEMEFDYPTWLSENDVFFVGRHIFYDPDGDRQEVYVSYRMKRIDKEWYIIGVGSSPQPIENNYEDFRYR